jgi:hypothetical protein
LQDATTGPAKLIATRPEPPDLIMVENPVAGRYALERFVDIRYRIGLDQIFPLGPGKQLS